MKIRSGFVSNSSSSSFVLLKDSISKIQLDMIISYQDFIKIFINLDKQRDYAEDLIDKFSYYDTDPWRITEYDDFIFGETSMDNFSMEDYLNYIKVDSRYVCWDDGYGDQPYSAQLKFIKKLKKQIRKNKIININNNIDYL